MVNELFRCHFSRTLPNNIKIYQIQQKVIVYLKANDRPPNWWITMSAPQYLQFPDSHTFSFRAFWVNVTLIIQRLCNGFILLNCMIPSIQKGPMTILNIPIYSYTILYDRVTGMDWFWDLLNPVLINNLISDLNIWSGGLVCGLSHLGYLDIAEITKLCFFFLLLYQFNYTNYLITIFLGLALN